MNTMSFGSGKPAWARDNEDGVPVNRRSPGIGGSGSGSGGGGSYQNDTGYRPPQLGLTYAEQQSHILDDTMRTHVHAESTANTLLATLHSQRQQLQNANEDTRQMRSNVAEASRELKELQRKVMARKRKLYIMIGMLALADTMLFLRIVQCGGSFFCRSHY
ncbi:hypothetical protein ACHAWU_001529 [Discostella pseudostelligera]|uniref:Uncharacterized protein n=1 Tax=Discostella pseudostelligera TaxID=259834 RepID=A0ABD3MP06_9STRA